MLTRTLGFTIICWVVEGIVFPEGGIEISADTAAMRKTIHRAQQTTRFINDYSINQELRISVCGSRSGSALGSRESIIK
jgi:hypothetical protein